METLQIILYNWKKQLDPRVNDLPLISSSYQVPLIIFAYLYFVFDCGPRFMKNKSPYSLKTFMKIYNIVQIFGNLWLIYDHIQAGLFSISLICPVFDYSYDPIPMRLTKSFWYYFLFKIIDYVETIVFVLRKKESQLSALHLYHHISTLILAWIGIRYYAVGPLGILTTTNCFIHAIMYTYYFLATLGPNIQKSIAPLKRWITIAQMIQFVFLILYTSQQIILNCKMINNMPVIITIINLIINFYMFYNFYQQTYKKSKKT